MDRKGVDQPLNVVTAAYRHLRRVRVTEEVMAEFVREVEATSSRIYVPVHQRDTEVSNLYICCVATCIADIQGEGEKADSLASTLKVAQRPTGGGH